MSKKRNNTTAATAPTEAPAVETTELETEIGQLDSAEESIGVDEPASETAETPENDDVTTEAEMAATDVSTEPEATAEEAPVVEEPAAVETPTPTPAEPASRWEEPAATPADAPEVAVFKRTIDAYVKEMAANVAVEIRTGANHQSALFRGVMQAIEYSNGQHFGHCMKALTEALGTQSAFGPRHLFRFLDARDIRMTKPQIEEFKDFFTVLVSVSTSNPGERALVSSRYNLQLAFRCIKNETYRQRFMAWYKQFCAI
jgi:hypothetical protein